jgi:hypothetical protein
MNCTECCVPLHVLAVNAGVTVCRPCRQNARAKAVRAPKPPRVQIRDWPAEYARRNAYLVFTPDPLNRALRNWQGGEPRSDWRADTGVPCWNPMRAAA